MVLKKIAMVLVVTLVIGLNIWNIGYALDSDTKQGETEGRSIYDNYSTTLAELDGRRLFIYGLIDDVDIVEKENTLLQLVFNLDRQVTRENGAELLYRTIILIRNTSGDDNKNQNNDVDTIGDIIFTDVPLDNAQQINELYELGITGGIGNNLFGYGQIMNIDQFLCMILRYLGEYTEYNNIIQDSIRVGLINIDEYTADKILLNGDMYGILSRLLDIVEFRTDRIETKHQMIKPDSIDLYVSSYEDGMEQLEEAMQYAPDRITVYFGDECTKEDIEKLFNTHLLAYYSWLNNVYDTYLYNEYVKNYSFIDLSPNYDSRYESHWYKIGGEDGDALVELREQLSIKEGAGELVSNEVSYIFGQELFKRTADYKKIWFDDVGYSEQAYLNLDLRDWIQCTENLEYNIYYEDESEYDNLEEIENKALELLNSPEIIKLKGSGDTGEVVSDYEKIKGVHDLICRKAQYDYSGLRKMNNGEYDGDMHSIIGFLVDGKIVCDGYARVYKWLLNYLGIECVIIYGQSGYERVGHAWNKVKLDNKWYNVDVCWADTGEGNRYFLKSDQYYKSHQHWPYNDSFSKGLEATENYR